MQSATTQSQAADVSPAAAEVLSAETEVAVEQLHTETACKASAEDARMPCTNCAWRPCPTMMLWAAMAMPSYGMEATEARRTRLQWA